MSIYRRIVFLVSIFVLFCPGAGAVGGQERGELNIIVATVDSRNIEDEKGGFVSDYLNFELPYLLEKGLYRGDLFAWVDYYEDRDLYDPILQKDILIKMREDGIDIVILVTLEGKGRETYIISTELIDIRKLETIANDSVRVRDRVVVEEGAKFDLIGDRVSQLMGRVARRIALGRTTDRSFAQDQIPEKRVYIHCIEPENPNNRLLESLSRRLTLELPYFVGRYAAEKTLPYVIFGVKPWQYEKQCFLPTEKRRDYSGDIREYEQYDLIVRGWIRSIKGQIMLDFSASPPFGKTLVPIYNVAIEQERLFDEERMTVLGADLIMSLETRSQ